MPPQNNISSQKPQETSSAPPVPTTATPPKAPSIPLPTFSDTKSAPIEDAPLDASLIVPEAPAPKADAHLTIPTPLAASPPAPPLDTEALQNKAQHEIEDALKELKPDASGALLEEIEKSADTPLDAAAPQSPKAPAPPSAPIQPSAPPPQRGALPVAAGVVAGAAMTEMGSTASQIPGAATTLVSSEKKGPLSATFKPLPKSFSETREANPTQDALVAKLKANQTPTPAPSPVIRDPLKSSPALEALVPKTPGGETKAEVPAGPTLSRTAPIANVMPEAPAPKEGLRNIRTFKTDVQNTLVKQQTSIVSAITAEEDRRARRPHATLAEKANLVQRLGLIGISLIFVLGGVGTIAYVYFASQGTAPDVPLPIASPIFTESEKGLDVTGLQRSAFLKTLESEKDAMTLSLAAVGQLYLYQKTLLGSKLLSTHDFLERIESNMPESGQRALLPELFIGIHAFDGNQPFLLLRTNYYESAYAGMLEWERDMQTDLAPFFGAPFNNFGRVPGAPVQPTTTGTPVPPVTSTSTATSTTPSTTGGTTGGTTTGSATGGSTTGTPTTGGTTGGSGTGSGTTGGGSSTSGSSTGGSTTGSATTGGSGTTGFVPPPPPPPPPPGAWQWLFGEHAHAQGFDVPSSLDSATSTASTTASTTPPFVVNRPFVPLFTDTVIRNYDVRELKDVDGNTVLLYGFPFPDTLIITTNQYTFIEAVTRLVHERN